MLASTPRLNIMSELRGCFAGPKTVLILSCAVGVLSTSTAAMAQPAADVEHLRELAAIVADERQRIAELEAEIERRNAALASLASRIEALEAQVTTPLQHQRPRQFPLSSRPQPRPRRRSNLALSSMAIRCFDWQRFACNTPTATAARPGPSGACDYDSACKASSRLPDVPPA
jgi:hypothetical protein